MASFRPPIPPPLDWVQLSLQCGVLNQTAVAVGESAAVRCGMADSPSNGADGVIRDVKPLGTNQSMNDTESDDRTCSVCGAESEQSYSCSECGKLFDDDKQRDSGRSVLGGGS